MPSAKLARRGTASPPIRFIPRQPRFVPPEGVPVACGFPVSEAATGVGRRIALTLRCISVAAALLAGVVAAHARETPRAGSIHGHVLDAATRRPLAAAAVVVLDRSLAAVTGDDGRFTLTDVPAGLHRVQIVLLGYESGSTRAPACRTTRTCAWSGACSWKD